MADKVSFNSVEAGPVKYSVSTCSEPLTFVEEPGHTSTGGKVWNTSIVLARYLEDQSRKSQGKLANRIILEVGAGCGLLGCVLACIGSHDHVWITDLGAMLPHLQQQVDRNRSLFKSSDVQVKQIDWCEPSDTARIAAEAAAIEDCVIDTIVGTDVVFAPELVDPLVSVLTALSTPMRTKTYICVEERDGSVYAVFLETMKENRFEVRRIASKKWPQDVQFEKDHVHLLQCVLKRSAS